MKITSDTFKIEVTYNELLFMYKGMLKALDEMPNKHTQEFMDKDRQCFELAVILGKQDEFIAQKERTEKMAREILGDDVS